MQLLDDLHNTLMGTGITALNQVAAIAGLGGIGKTQTAVEYAYRHFRDTPTYDWVFWVKADTELAVVTGMADLARSLDLGEGSLDELAGRSLQWLDTHDRWLLIFDNADEPQWVKPWLPRNPKGRVLLTSRAQRFTSLGIRAPLTVNKLSQNESIAFLQDRTDRPSLTPDELAAVTALATALDGLPLALEQAAAYLQRTGVSFAVYWKHYQQQSLTLLEKELPQTGDYPNSVATTWLLNVEEVERRSPASIPILQLSAVLAADDISEALLLNCAEQFELTDCTDELALGEQLAALADFSLIQRERKTTCYSIHRMVQTVIWHRLTPTDQHTWLHRAIAGLTAVFPDVQKIENWAVCKQLTPHVQAIAARPESVALESTDWAWLLVCTGYYLKDQGRYSETEPLYVRSLAIYEQQLGREHPHVASSLNNLAALYRSQGRYSEAEPLYVRSLSIREQQLDREHPDVATSLNNLANLYKSQGRYSEAEPLFVRSLSIREQQLDREHPDVATSLNNLAGLYESQGRYSEAEPLFVRSLAIWEQQLGREHPHVAASLNNLAGLYESQGRYSEAEPLFVRSLAIWEQQLGREHPHVAASLNNLAGLYESQGRYADAEPLYLRSLAIREQQLGREHPDVAISLWNMAGLYYNMNRLTEAKPLISRAVTIFERTLGDQHPDTTNARQWWQTIHHSV
ncbi:tetratricopeptide repeat protein [Oscillatoria sp. FACHB-1407]|nr:tetratricopeptide repeat protein [Oscillatoria sp. FACHB-1407]